MDNIFLLAIGIVVVIIGIYFLFREERANLSYNDAERIFNLMNEFDLKVNSSLNAIEDKTNESLKKISEVQNKGTVKGENNEPIKVNDKPLSKIKLKHKDVYDLFRQGLSSKEIAMKLKKGVGEIETIISLFNLERE